MKISEDEYKRIMPVSIGLELETNRELVETLNRQMAPLLCMETHREGSRIMEANLKPAYTKSIVDVALSGEIIRRFNPFHWNGQADNASGSAHCHVNQPKTSVLVDEYRKYNKSLHSRPMEDVANLFWNVGVQAGLLPFLSLGYLKRTSQYTFRAKIHYITASNVFRTGRGTGMMCNTEVPYGDNGFGLEYRTNENTPLWIYILPLLVLNVNKKTEFGKKLTELRQSYKDASDVSCQELAAHSGTIQDTLEEIRPYLLENVDLMASVVNDNEKELFKKLMTAYIIEDIDTYDEIIKELLNKNLGVKDLLTNVDVLIHTDEVIKHVAPKYKEQTTEERVEYLTAVYPNIHIEGE